ncbi:MAG: hypothetical protein A2015_05050 [Spirochaetes bacterium GWF1_31_7]|nr:MAG: hypothetical protein A2015_05050 [Spirochaetes bacterium GWF1_31_7]OHD52644.1 MAG: hypothetical protein A2Y29_09715 [Spirochaetes bacterium GWE2_31_10]OHD75479.1 MAG: hypothetical protein A2355_15695 [Spirochaetes bacterium RIFOXYB1_FULL_32_8]HBD94526.1 hypothetical protein [Spirochaetia bacterium]HBI36195.1 hypothetical protein [Spirochaetia bacterium]
MNAIEFQTTVHNGIIELPKEYSIRSNQDIKVIIMYNDTNDKPKEQGIIQSLINKPVVINAFTPLSRDEIYE